MENEFMQVQASNDAEEAQTEVDSSMDTNNPRGLLKTITVVEKARLNAVRQHYKQLYGSEPQF